MGRYRILIYIGGLFGALIISLLLQSITMYVGAIPAVIVFSAGMIALRKLKKKSKEKDDEHEEEYGKTNVNGSDDV